MCRRERIILRPLFNRSYLVKYSLQAPAAGSFGFHRVINNSCADSRGSSGCRHSLCSTRAAFSLAMRTRLLACCLASCSARRSFVSVSANTLLTRSSACSSAQRAILSASRSRLLASRAADSARWKASFDSLICWAIT